MNIYQLRAFSVLSHLLHYQKAAERLGVSQPSLSRTIRSLEEELGVPLFERQGRGVVLSRYGAVFAVHIGAAIRELDTGIARVHDLANPQRPTVNISLNFYLSTSYFPALLSRFHARYGRDQLFFQLSQSNTPAILEELRSGVCELGFCSYLDDQPDIRFEPVIRCPLCAVVPHGHPLARQKSTTLAEVSRCPMILSTDKTHYIDDLLRKEGLSPEVAFRMGEDHAIANLVAHHYGVSILPREEQLRACGVELVPLRDASAFRIFYMATSRNHLLSTPAKSFYRFVMEDSRQTGSL